MTAPVQAGLSPAGGGPVPIPQRRALDAAAKAAEQHDLPVTMRQLALLVEAISPYLADIPNHRSREFDAVPYLRLIRSLITAGWTVKAIASRMGFGQPALSQILRLTQISPSMAQRVERVFLELYGVDPIAAGVPRQGVTRAQNLGRASGWELVPAEEVAEMRSRSVHAA